MGNTQQDYKTKLAVAKQQQQQLEAEVAKLKADLKIDGNLDQMIEKAKLKIADLDAQIAQETQKYDELTRQYSNQ